jgi:mannose-1-phosphate guanylyltransferase
MLAGGDGRRLHGITRDDQGRVVPKQYCDFGTGRSLICRTLDRALLLAPHDRVISVVSAAHREWWERDLEVLPDENIVAQPANRGTAAGILLPLLHIAARDPHAAVVVLPSDHHVEDEPTLSASVGEALQALERHPEKVILLGITPEHPDVEYGWVLPDASDGSHTHPVAAFVEKPAELDAVRLMAIGAVWNSFMFTARAATLIGIFEQRLPDLVRRMRAALDAHAADLALVDLYQSLEPHDYSREVLQAMPSRLRVYSVPACGWTDLGTPDRLARVIHGGPAPSRHRPAA